MLPYHLDAAKQIAGRAGAAVRRRDGRAGSASIVAEREPHQRRAVRRSTSTSIPSGANFVLFRTRSHDAGATCGRRLVDRSVLVRDCSGGRASTAACASPSARRRERPLPDRPRRGDRTDDMSRGRRPASGRRKETSIEVSIDLDGTGRHRRARPASRSTTTCSTSSVATAASISPCSADGRPAHRHPPHGRGRGDHARRGVRRGARRQGAASAASPAGCIPLDEALVEVALDLSGRPFVAWDVPLPECLPLGNPAFDPQLAEHAVSSFATERRHHAARQAAGAGATCTTSSRPRSRAWPAACATPCASTVRPRCRSTKGVL